MTCGIGERSRQRMCNSPPPQHGGDQCDGDDQQSKKCKLAPCPGKPLRNKNAGEVAIKSRFQLLLTACMENYLCLLSDNRNVQIKLHRVVNRARLFREGSNFN